MNFLYDIDDINDRIKHGKWKQRDRIKMDLKIICGSQFFGEC